MDARIYKPGKSAMQSGRGKRDKGDWVLEYESRSRRRPNALMGWAQADDTLGQIRLYFKTPEDALSYARKKGMDASILPAQERKIRPRNYTDNFKT